MNAHVPSLSRWPARRLAALVFSIVLAVASLGAAKALHDYSGIEVGPNDYNIPAWELRNVPSKWLFAAGELFRTTRSREQQDADLLRFFQLTREIDSLERQEGDEASRGADVSAKQAELQVKRKERDRLENRVEATIESRLTAVIQQAGITRDLGPLGHIVWPPVDFELTRSPRTLAVSPRDRIELKDSRLLREDLDIEEVEAIEAEVSLKENVAALAFPTGGIGAYPTIIDYPSSYRDALEVVAHEWTHNFLTFRPLGFNYYRSSSLRSINETVANIVGRELAVMAAERWPLVETSAPRERPAFRSERVDVGAELRALRAEVDELLAIERIDEAEALMEQRRQELFARGVYIRKLNQAYFAFVNLYSGRTGSPGATNPIGPKIDEIRRRAGSLSAFVRIVGGVTSIADLDQALSKLLQ